MNRVIRACGLFALLFVSVLFPAFLSAQAPSHLDADKRVYPSPFLPEALPPAAAQPLEVAQSPQAVQPRVADDYLPWSRIVYYARGLGNWDIFITEDTGANAVRLTKEKATEVEPDLNRGGTHIVYASDVDGDFDLYVMRLSDQAVVRLLDTPANENMPVWSPDGGRIAFQSDRHGQMEVYVVDVNGGNLRRLTNHPDIDAYPAWSPDGSRLAYSSRQNGQIRVWVMNADGSGQTRLSDQPGGLYPTWSPGGGEIAYSADGNGDGWLELWNMAADGQRQHIVISAGSEADMMARSWSPDARRISYTFVRYIEYQGQWYIQDTSIESTELEFPNRETIGTPVNYPFGPGWQTLDHKAPISGFTTLPPVSPGPITLRWNVADQGAAGIREHAIQVKTGDGPWTNWATNPPGVKAQFDAVGGRTYAFRSRAIDMAFNAEPWPAVPEAITTVEALPPITSLSPLPAFSRVDETFALTRSGIDPGQSGIANYLFQWRRNGGAWTDRPEEWTSNQTSIDPKDHGIIPGDTVAFRLRGTDAAHNVEPWPADPGDAATTFYSWGATGRVIDNTGTPVGGATVTTAPAMLGQPLSGPDGGFARYLGVAVVPVTLAWAKPGYGELPATVFVPAADIALDATLPPIDDAVAGGDFEAAGWGAWQPGGALAPALSAEARHTGRQGALLAPRPALFGPAYRLSATPSMLETNVRLSVHGGAATVVWIEGGDWLTTLRAARRGPGGVWSPSETLLSSVVWGDFDLTAGGDGRLHVVARTESGLVYLRQTGETTWAAPEPIPASTPSQNPQIVRGFDGAIHLFWEEHNSPIINVRYSRRDPSGGWSAPIAVANLGEAAIGGLGAVVSPDGRLHLAYLEWNFENAIGDRLWVRERRPDGSWTGATLLQQAKRLQLDLAAPPVISNDGRVHLLWRKRVSETGEPTTDYTYYTTQHGAVWDEPRAIFTGVAVEQVVVGPDGALHILGHGYNEIRYSTTAGQLDGGWLPPQLVPGETLGRQVLLIDGDGLPHVIRGGFNGEYYQSDMEYTRRLPSGEWTEAASVSTGFIKNYQPAAALDAGGNVHVAWLVEDAQTSPTHPDVVYAGPVPGAAGEAILSQTVAVPDVEHPALSFFYGFGGGLSAATRLEVAVGDDPARPLPATAGIGASSHHWLDLAGYAGMPVDVTFRLAQAAGEPAAWAAVDDVSLGAATGDAWSAGASRPALPGEAVDIVLNAGNRGGVAAEAVELTLALPPELTFTHADLTPDTTNPLRWILGTLSPGQTRTVRVTAAVKSSAAPFTAVEAVAEVTFPGELETHNNAVEITINLEKTIHLPAITR